MKNYQRLGGVAPLAFSRQDNVEKSYVDDDEFSYPAQNGGEFGKDILMGSPGGLASNLQHWTGGFYGKGGSSSDKFIGKKSPPYISSEYGNIYSDETNPELNDTFEYLPFKKMPETENVGASCSASKPLAIRQLVLLAVVLTAFFLVLTLWQDAFIMAVEHYFNEGEPLSMKDMFVYAACGTVALIVVSWVFGLNLPSIVGE
jgi:hypothetical protein